MLADDSNCYKYNVHADIRGGSSARDVKRQRVVVDGNFWFAFMNTTFAGYLLALCVANLRVVYETKVADVGMNTYCNIY